MGAGASLQPNAMECLNSQASKPLDASDVNDVDTAKSELSSARKMAQYYRNLCLPRFAVDLTGDGFANAVGFDTNGNGQADSFDTTGDGLIDSVLIHHQGRFFISPVYNNVAPAPGNVQPTGGARTNGRAVNKAVVAGVAASQIIPVGATASLANGRVVSGDTIQQGIGTVGSGIASGASSVGSGVKSAMNSGFAQNAQATVVAGGEMAVSGATQVGATIVSGAEAVGNSGFAQNAQATVVAGGEMAVSGATQVGATVVSGAQAIGNSGVAQGAVAGGSIAVGAVGSSIGDFAESDLAKNAQAAAGAGGNLAIAGASGVGEVLKNAMASGMDMLHSIGDKASEAFQSTSASGVADTIAGAAQNVGGFVAKGVDVASAVAKEVGDMMK